MNTSEQPPVPSSIPVTSMTHHEFVQLGKVPDFVNNIPEFHGHGSSLPRWILEVENVLKIYERLPRDSIEYHIIEGTIRRKIKGEAANVLDSNCVAADWNTIKRTLLLYYKDKRDLKTLDYELTLIKKKPSESLSSYFSRVNDLQTAIIMQIQSDPKYASSYATHISYFREKCLDSFIRGLEKPLSFLLKNYNPNNLSTAFNYCLDFYNMDMRSTPFSDKQNHNIPKPRELNYPTAQHPQFTHHRQPPVHKQNSFQFNLPRPYFQPRNSFTPNNYQFAPRNYYQRRSNYPPNQHNPYYPQQIRNNFPVPMEVDQSLQSNVRQNFNAKRPRASSSHNGNAHVMDIPPIGNTALSNTPLEYVTGSQPLDETYFEPNEMVSQNNDHTYQSHFLEWNANW